MLIEKDLEHDFHSFSYDTFHKNVTKLFSFNVKMATKEIINQAQRKCVIIKEQKTYQTIKSVVKFSDLQKDSLAQQALLLSSHHKVMCFIFVIDDVFQVYSSMLVKILEELLIEYVCNTTDLLDASFGFCSAVNEIGCDCNCQLSTKFLSFKFYFKQILQTRNKTT